MNISGGNATAKEKREGFNQRARGGDEIQKSRMNQAKEKKANGVRRGKTGCVSEVALEGKPGGKQTGPLRNNKKAEEDFKFSCSVEYTWSVLAFIYGCLLNDRSDWFPLALRWTEAGDDLALLKNASIAAHRTLHPKSGIKYKYIHKSSLARIAGGLWLENICMRLF